MTSVGVSAYQWLYLNDCYPIKDCDSYKSSFQTAANVAFPLGAFCSVLFSKNLMHYPKWKMVNSANIIMMVGTVIMMENMYVNIMVARFLQGLAAGMMSVFVPTSVSQMVP